jgi:O-antigen/teichoic acid export membrane protein
MVSLKTLTSKIKELIPQSIQFGLMQLSATLMFSTQALIVGKVAGLKDAGEYGLVQKLFLVLNILHFAVLTPLWSAYTESIASKDIIWAKKALMYSVIYSVSLLTIGSAGLYIFCFPIIFLWTGKTITNTLLYVFMGVWIFTTGWVNCFSVYLNGIGKLKLQTMLIVPAAIIYVPLALYLGGKIGIIGVCLAGTIVLVTLTISNPIQSIMSLKDFDKLYQEVSKKHILMD